MEITIDLENCKIITHIDEWNQYAVFISKLTGETVRLTIPQLIESIKDAKIGLDS